ncbi:MAG: ABC transporter substrate-binding protein [Lachnospiraceae bacterium]|nr:ABC transporter substrate-binding protein [Lachnospiraceae bacterium]
MKRKVIAAIMAVALIGTCVMGCGSTGDGTGEQTENTEVTLDIAYQYGLAYAPIVIAQEQGLIEEAYKEATGDEVQVNWNQMSSGPDINTGIASGSIQVGFMGIAPAITGVMNNVGYKIFTNLSGQEHGLTTSDASIKSLEDLVGSDKQIALVNIGSFQHIILAKALVNAGLDAHALDANIVAMKHPDGMAALESGSIPCHLTSSPYIHMERENENLYEIPGVKEAFSVEDSFIVGVASTTLNEENPELYQALCDAMAEAIDYINENPKEAAAITCEYDGNDAETELKYMESGYYSTETKGVYDLAVFMAENGFIEKAPEEFSDLVFDNVSGN